jgi:hypothetical protein
MNLPDLLVVVPKQGLPGAVSVELVRLPVRIGTVCATAQLLCLNRGRTRHPTNTTPHRTDDVAQHYGPQSLPCCPIAYGGSLVAPLCGVWLTRAGRHPNADAMLIQRPRYLPLQS